MKAALTIFYDVYLKSVRNRLLSFGLLDEIRAAFLIFVVVVFLGGFFLIFARLIYYADSIFLIGPLLVGKFFSLGSLAFWWLAFFSSVVAAYKHFYFQKDIPVLLSMPVGLRDFFVVKFISVLKDTSFSGGLLILPIVAAIGAARSAPFDFYIQSYLALIPFFVSAAALGSLSVMGISAVFPAARSRRIVWTGLAAGFSIFYILARIIVEPLSSLIPSGDQTAFALAAYLSFMEKPAAMYFPSGLYSSITLLASSGGAAILWGAWIGSLLYALFPVVLCAIFIKKYYASSFSSRNDSRRVGAPSIFFEKFLHSRRRCNDRFSALRSLFIVDIKSFVRDPRKWSQFALVSGLVVVYGVSMARASMGADTIYLKMLVALLGPALAAVICAALSARFVFSEMADPSTLEEFRALNFFPIKIETIAREKFLTRAVVVALSCWLLGLVSVFLSASRARDFVSGTTSFMFPVSATSVVFLGGVCWAIASWAFYRGVVKMKTRCPDDVSPESSPEGILFSATSLFYIVLNFIVFAAPLRGYYFAVLSDGADIVYSLRRIIYVAMVLFVANMSLAIYLYKKSIRVLGGEFLTTRANGI